MAEILSSRRVPCHGQSYSGDSRWRRRNPLRPALPSRCLEAGDCLLGGVNRVSLFLQKPGSFPAPVWHAHTSSSRQASGNAAPDGRPRRDSLEFQWDPESFGFLADFRLLGSGSVKERPRGGRLSGGTSLPPRFVLRRGSLVSLHSTHRGEIRRIRMHLAVMREQEGIGF